MKRTTILADESLILEVKQYGEETGKSTTEIVQDALREYLKARRHQRKPLSFVGIGRSGREDISARAEEILEASVDKEKGWA